ncbi:MAG: hypothetical protein MZW92_01655 [Comamonadaceae bacterium]|nr:hypothetical protein [Comamonadaceae bacterium]
MVPVSFLGMAPVTGWPVARHRPATTDRVEAALARAVGWVERSREPGGRGLSEMVDERLLLRLLAELAPSPEEQARLAEALRAHLARLEPALALWCSGQQTPWEHYHLTLAAHLMRGARHPSRFERVIVGEAQRALVAAPDEHPTVRLAIALFIGGLGEQPGVSVEALLGESLIARIGRGGPEVLLLAERRDPEDVRMALYALVHELLALTDFGRRAATPWLTERLEGVRQVLPEAIDWARGQGDLTSRASWSSRVVCWA